MFVLRTSILCRSKWLAEFDSLLERENKLRQQMGKRTKEPEKKKSAEAIKRVGGPNRESSRVSAWLGRLVVHTANRTLPIEKNFRKLPLVIRTIFVQRMSGNGEEIAASLRSKRSRVYSTVARASVVQLRTSWLVIE